jgi:hypothetical protein
MTITKEQLARLREISKLSSLSDYDISETLEALPALLDEVERLQVSDHKLKIVLFCTKGLDVFGELEGIDEILVGLNEWADKKALENLAIEGARVFDAVIEEIELHQTLTNGWITRGPNSLLDILESQRDRILRGGEK